MAEVTDNIRSNIPRADIVQSNMESRLAQFRAKQAYLKKYPWAKNWTLENFVNFERNATPVSVNGMVRIPSTYKGNTTSIS